jgi:hypothetical protein
MSAPGHDRVAGRRENLQVVQMSTISAGLLSKGRAFVTALQQVHLRHVLLRCT